MGGIFKVGLNPAGNNSKWIVVSVGGSLIAPKDGIDVAFLNSFKKMIIKLIEEKEMRFVIVCGGGKTARDYQNACKEADPKTSDFDLDLMGIEATKLNAYLMGIIFGDIADQEIICDPTRNFFTNKNIVIASGWKPGCSTDYDAVLLALSVEAKKIINISNIDAVYDGDPRNNPHAKRLREISWDEYLKLIPEKWIPGLSTPFDPVASKEAKKHGMEVFVINGNRLDSIKSYLELGFFNSGTIIKKEGGTVYEPLLAVYDPLLGRVCREGLEGE